VGRTALVDFCIMQKFLIMGGFNSFLYKIGGHAQFYHAKQKSLYPYAEKKSH
jgi:hypothetical protein